MGFKDHPMQHTEAEAENTEEHWQFWRYAAV